MKALAFVLILEALYQKDVAFFEQMESLVGVHRRIGRMEWARGILKMVTPDGWSGGL